VTRQVPRNHQRLGLPPVVVVPGRIGDVIRAESKRQQENQLLPAIS
jgi:hypothetical protein